MNELTKKLRDCVNNTELDEKFHIIYVSKVLALSSDYAHEIYEVQLSHNQKTDRVLCVYDSTENYVTVVNNIRLKQKFQNLVRNFFEDYFGSRNPIMRQAPHNQQAQERIETISNIKETRNKDE